MNQVTNQITDKNYLTWQGLEKETKRLLDLLHPSDVSNDGNVYMLMKQNVNQVEIDASRVLCDAKAFSALFIGENDTYVNFEEATLFKAHIAMRRARTSNGIIVVHINEALNEARKNQARKIQAYAKWCY